MSRDEEQTVGVGGKRRRKTSHTRGRSTGTGEASAPARLRFAVKVLDEGLRYVAARGALVERFGISERSAERDLAAAYAAIAAEHEHERPVLAARILGRAWRLSVNAERRRDTAGALAGLALVAKVAGLAVERMSVTSNTRGDGLTDDELSILAALKIPAPRNAEEGRLVIEALKLTPAARLAEQARLETETITQGDDDDAEG